ncbi:MAG: S41 family peptidase [Eubacterium sp.]|nr:S41 family peptidase [Eubacterium sp.]
MIFDNYITRSKRFEKYIPINKTVSTITRDQALEDLSELIYLIDNRYCGKEYWENQGISFDLCYKEIADYIADNEEIYISDFCRKIHLSFDRGIVDNHFSFASPLTGLLRFSKQYSAYFCDFIVEKTDKIYKVIKSSDNAVKVDSVIQGENCFYKTLSPKNKEYFLVGCRSFEPVRSVKLQIDNKFQNVSVHRCRAIEKTETLDVCMQPQVKDSVNILRSNCCDYVGGLNEKTDFIAMGERYKNDKVLVLDYLSNQGGYNRITREFIQGLNGYVHCEENCATLVSPVTENKDCYREWIIEASQPYNIELGKFNGTLIMLINGDTASSGETAILYAKSLRNFILIGENSMGCNTFGNVASYSLKNSKIAVRIPNTLNLCADPEDCAEGKGFTPNFWVDSVNVQDDVLKWIKENLM